MKIVKVDHTDFELIIECNNIEEAFNKAKKKQSNILSSTYYKINEGDISIFNFETNQLDRIRNSSTYPLIFENKDYFIGISFKQKNIIESPCIRSQLKEVEEKFYFRKEIGFLSGTLNFGNELGKCELIVCYLKSGIQKNIKLEFEVFPTKLDFKSDYTKILLDIEKEYPYLVLDFLKKTYSSFKTGNSPNTDLIWWQVFRGLYEEFIKSSNFILNKPHNRIVNDIKYVNVDKIQKWNSTLEEEFEKSKHFPEKKYRYEVKTLSTNSTENQFLKYAINQTQARFVKIKSFIELSYPSLISEKFKIELNSIDRQFKTLSSNPFFRNISQFKGIKQESLVLQKATGYSSIYKIWIMLNSGIQFLEGIQKIELKNVADLYQIWCFLEIKNIVQKLIGQDSPSVVKFAEIQVDDFVFSIKRGGQSKVSFVRENGDIIELFHDYSFGTTAGSVKSYTVNQRPDIVLKITKNDLKDNYVLTYLFDAKYRLESDLYDSGIDFPPEDAINQMHRYRDAIYYVNKELKKPEKEVIGAYILFPGSGELSTIKNNEYFKSISQVNIGAFPLRPNDPINKILIEQHLSDILQNDTNEILKNIIPQKDNIYETNNPTVMIGFVQSLDNFNFILNDTSPFYYCSKNIPKNFGEKNLKYFVPFLKGKGVSFYFEILDYSFRKRKDIFPNNHVLYKNDVDERLIIRLGRKYKIDKGQFLKLPDSDFGKSLYKYVDFKFLKNLKNLK